MSHSPAQSALITEPRARVAAGALLLGAVAFVFHGWLVAITAVPA